MPKIYLRYALKESFGVISSSNCIFENSERTVLTGALERVIAWNLKRSEKMWCVGAPSLVSGGSGDPTSDEASLGAKTEVTLVALSPDGTVVSTGHLDGSVRIWSRSRSKIKSKQSLLSRPVNEDEELLSALQEKEEEEEGNELPITLSGHKTAVTALSFGNNGAFLASGSKDTDIVVWDVTGERGLFRLRGHTGQITSICWIESQKVLISSSKDGLVKVWDTESQQCIQTVVSHMTEVLCACLSPQGDLYYTGAADGKIHVWKINSIVGTKQPSSSSSSSSSSSPELLVELGELLPPLSSQSSQQQQQMDVVQRSKITSITTNGDGSLLACIVGERVVAFWKVLEESEIEKKRKRHEQRERAKKRQHEDDNKETMKEAEQQKEDDAEEEEKESKIEDEYRYLFPLRTNGKIKSIALSKKGDKALLSLNNNSVELYSLFILEHQKEAEEPKSTNDQSSQTHFKLETAISQPGHRTDVRALALASDDSLLVTVSNGNTKIWNVSTQTCLRTIECGYGLSATITSGNRYVIIGTKEGTLQVVELNTGIIVDEVEAHTGAIWSICSKPDGSGIISGSADHTIKFWDFDLKQKAGSTSKLTLVESKAITMDDDVLCVKISSDSKLLAVALLDCTIKVFKLQNDQVKFFLSLFGHKLPVLSIDFSFDSRLLASGSADKNIKIWGMDFGDCHKSLFAHNDSVTQVLFVPGTHYLFSVGKDGALKHWDGDKFELIQSLDGQRGIGSACWCVAVGGNGTLIITSGHDRSIRLFERTHEQLFLEEEHERTLDSQFESAIEEQEDFAARNDPTRPESEEATRKTLATVRSGEELIEALDLAEEEEAKRIVLSAQRKQAQENGEALPPPPQQQNNPLLLGMNEHDYILHKLTEIPAGHLEQALILLPFHHIESFLKFATTLISQGKRVELCSQCVFFLLKLHHAQISISQELIPVIDELLKVTRNHLQHQKDVIGFNLAAMRFLQQQVEAESGARLYSELEEKLAEIKLGSMKKKKSRSKSKQQSSTSTTTPAKEKPQVI